MGGINRQSYEAHNQESESQVTQINNDVDQIKDLKEDLANKRISNERAHQKITQLWQDMMTRFNAMDQQSLNNPAMIPALAKGVSILNRFMIISGGQGDPQMINMRNNMIALLEMKGARLPSVGEAGVAKSETNKNLEGVKVEAALMNFSGSSRDFFENPQFRNLALMSHKNWDFLNPEVTQILKGIIRDYYRVNGIQMLPDEKVRPIISKSGALGFIGDNQEISVTID